MNVYDVFGVNPITLMGEPDISVPINPPGLLVTVLLMIGSLPDDCVNPTLTEVALDALTVPIVGAFGFVVLDTDALDSIDVPPELVAVIVNVYAVFDDKPDTVIGEVRFVPVDVILPGLVTV